MPNALFKPRLSGRLWPIHLKPYDDELLSSWVVRLSRAYGVDPHRFGASGWRHPALWNRDIDKGIYDEVLQVLADKTATPLTRVRDTTLRGYPGLPPWELYGSRLSPWVLSLGLSGGQRHRP